MFWCVVVFFKFLFMLSFCPVTSQTNLKQWNMWNSRLLRKLLSAAVMSLRGWDALWVRRAGSEKEEECVATVLQSAWWTSAFTTHSAPCDITRYKWINVSITKLYSIKCTKMTWKVNVGINSFIKTFLFLYLFSFPFDLQLYLLIYTLLSVFINVQYLFL